MKRHIPQGQGEMAFSNEPFALTTHTAVDGARLQREGEQHVADRAEADTLQEIFGEVISSYSRAQAIEDGELVDLMQPETVQLVREAGFKYPMAMTRAAFYKTVRDDSNELPPGQDLNGRLWDVLWMLKCAIQRTRGGDTVAFDLRVRNWIDYPRSKRHVLQPVRLYSKCGPGDTAEPVITLMLPGES